VRQPESPQKAHTGYTRPCDFRAEVIAGVMLIHMKQPGIARSLRLPSMIKGRILRKFRKSAGMTRGEMAGPLPATIEEEAAGTRPEAVRRYQALGIECQQRAAAITELDRLLPAPEQTLGQLPDVTVRVLEAVVTVDREALVRRLRESGELEHLRSRFERLRTMANTHAAELDEWSQLFGRPLHVPRVVFPWPSAAIWDGLLAEGVEAPQLVWDDDAATPNV
jgi:hypothetical protein